VTKSPISIATLKLLDQIFLLRTLINILFNNQWRNESVNICKDSCGTSQTGRTGSRYLNEFPLETTVAILTANVSGQILAHPTQTGEEKRTVERKRKSVSLVKLSWMLIAGW